MGVHVKINQRGTMRQILLLETFTKEEAEIAKISSNLFHICLVPSTRPIHPTPFVIVSNTVLASIKQPEE